MKIGRLRAGDCSLILLSLLLLAPQAASAQRRSDAERAWGPFFAAFRRAVKERDRSALRGMMSDDFFSSGGNDPGQDAAFEFWDGPNVRGWEAFEKVLARGTVPQAAWWDAGRESKHPGRVAPPAANVRRNVTRGAVDWYAVFEFRDGRWYCTVFNQCCD
jgi:hypothetical protein